MMNFPDVGEVGGNNLLPILYNPIGSIEICLDFLMDMLEPFDFAVKYLIDQGFQIAQLFFLHA